MPLFDTILRKYPIAINKAQTPLDADASQKPVPQGIGKKLQQAQARVGRSASQLAQSRFNVKRVEHGMHADIGSLLDGMAQVHDLSVIHLLGLASLLRQMLELPDTRAELAVEGSRLYRQEHRLTSSLTMVGTLPDPRIGAELRKIGFARTGKQWGGLADIAEAISLARTHKLSLLRYEADHTPQFFLLKGEDQPALEKLLEEERLEQAKTESFLAEFENEATDRVEKAAAENEVPSFGPSAVPVPGSGSGHDLGLKAEDAPSPSIYGAPAVRPLEPREDEKKPVEVEIGLKRPGKANTD